MEHGHGDDIATSGGDDPMSPSVLGRFLRYLMCGEPRGDGHVRAIRDFDETQRVGQSQVERPVAADRRDGFDFQLG